jgi:2-isopropylmalate synthase
MAPLLAEGRIWEYAWHPFFMNQPRVTIYDTTLRDGTQGTGISFSMLDKIRVAEKLDEFGVHYIEGGFPGSNPKDAEFFAEAKKRKWKNAKVSAFGATRRGKMKVEDDPQVRILLEAETPAVTIVGKTWPLQVTEVLGVTREENLAMIADTVAYLKKHGREVLYDAEHFFDSYRDDPAYSLATLQAAHGAGADLVVLCDTNGGSLPEFIAQATRDAITVLGPGTVGIHTHNDSGLGVANALAAVAAGAVQVQGTINGYGERVGNCDLITVMANLELKLNTPVVPDLTQLRELSLFVDELANVPHNIRAPYVGTAAFTHKGGQHVHAVQKLASSYEHVDPVRVGNERNITISDMSGQSNVIVKAEKLGFKFSKGAPDVAKILSEVKRLESEGYEFEAAEGSFELLVRRQLGLSRPLFELQEYHCTYRRSGENRWNKCEATVKLLVNGTPTYTVAEGDGPVNAMDAALRKGLRPFYPAIDEVQLDDYKVRIINGQQGTAARTRVLIDSTDGHTSWGTVGVSDNIIEASWLALVDSFEFKLGREARP